MINLSPVRTLVVSLAALFPALPVSATNFEIELVPGDMFLAVWDGAIDLDIAAPGSSTIVSLGETFSLGNINEDGEVTPLLEAPENFGMGLERDDGDVLLPDFQVNTVRSQRLDVGDHALISQIGKVLSATRDIEDAEIEEERPAQTLTLTPATSTQVISDDGPDPITLNSNANKVTANLGAEIIKRSIRPIPGTTERSLDDYISAARTQLDAVAGDASSMPSNTVLRNIVNEACKALSSCEQTVSKISATNTAMARATDNKASEIVTQRLGESQTPESVEQNVGLQYALVNVSASLRDTQIRESVEMLNQAVTSLTNTVIEQATNEQEVEAALDTISRVVSKTSDNFEQSKASLNTLVEKKTEILSQANAAAGINLDETLNIEPQDTDASENGVVSQELSPVTTLIEPLQNLSGAPVVGETFNTLQLGVTTKMNQLFEDATVSLAQTGLQSVAQIVERSPTAATMILSEGGSNKIKNTVSTMTRKLVIENFGVEDRLKIDNTSFRFTNLSEGETRILSSLGIVINIDDNAFVPTNASPN